MKGEGERSPSEKGDEGINITVQDRGKSQVKANSGWAPIREWPRGKERMPWARGLKEPSAQVKKECPGHVDEGASPTGD